MSQISGQVSLPAPCMLMNCELSCGAKKKKCCKKYKKKGKSNCKRCPKL